MATREVRRGPPDWLAFLEPGYPSANMVLIRGERPILVDTGFGGNLPETENLLRGAGVPPEELALIVNTHYHCDHVGGNSGLQRRYGTPIAAHRWDADLINRRDREVCSAEWLDQPVEPYRVDRPLSGGGEIETGSVSLQVLHTPGHTLGQVSLYEPEDRMLILGDAVHKDDVAWINPFREGAGALQRTLETLGKLADLPVHWAYSGHGPAIEDLGAAIQGARQRYTQWLDEPQKTHWHGCKRIFAYALMIKGGIPEEEIHPYLLRCPWFNDYARHGFEAEPEDFVEPLVAEMLRSGATEWREEKLVVSARTSHPRQIGRPAPRGPRIGRRYLNRSSNPSLCKRSVKRPRYQRQGRVYPSGNSTYY